MCKKNFACECDNTKRSRSRSFALPARRTTTGPVETHRGRRRQHRNTQRDRHKGAGVPGGVKRGERQQAVLANSQSLPARAYRRQPAAFAPRTLPVLLKGHFARGTIALLSVPAPLPVLSRLSCLLAGQELGVPWCAGVVALLGVIIRVEQGSAMFDAPTALRCPAPLAGQPRPILLGLHARPFGPGTTERCRFGRYALGGAGGTEVKLARLASVGPRTCTEGFAAHTVDFFSPARSSHIVPASLGNAFPDD